MLKPDLTVAIVAGLVGTNLVAYGCVVRIMKAYKEERRRFKKLHELTTYLINKLEEENVDFSEFDLIALGLIRERD